MRTGDCPATASCGREEALCSRLNRFGVQFPPPRAERRGEDASFHVLVETPYSSHSYQAPLRLLNQCFSIWCPSPELFPEMLVCLNFI